MVCGTEAQYHQAIHMANRRSKRVRLVDIASKAGVSASVVSAIVRGGKHHGARFGSETEDRVRRIVQELNYQPNLAARMLKGNRSNLIGVLIGATAEPINFARLAALEQEAYDRGYRVMIGQYRDNPAHTAGYVDDFLGHGVDAVLLFHGQFLSDERLLDALRRVPHLICQDQSVVENASMVEVNRAGAIRQAVEYLHERGRRRIGMMLSALVTRPMSERNRGYHAALAKLKLPDEPELLWSMKEINLVMQQRTSSQLGGGWTWTPPAEVVHDGIDQVVDRGAADAVIASNDVWAIELIKALRRRGKRVPEDVAVVGFDNLQAGALFDPALTTIDQNNPGFAHAAMDLVEQSLQTTRRRPRHVVVEARLVVRESA